MTTQYTNKSNARRAARKALGGTAAEGKDFNLVPMGDGFAWYEIDKPAPKKERKPRARKLFIAVCNDEETPPMNKTEARKAARDMARAANKDATIHSYPEDKLIDTVKPTPAKAKSIADKDSMANKCVELASRKQGATAAELNELTKWTGAPWKWMFTNPKGTGWCDRRSLRFETRKREPKGGKGRKVTTYHVLGPVKADAKAA